MVKFCQALATTGGFQEFIAYCLLLIELYTLYSVRSRAPSIGNCRPIKVIIQLCEENLLRHLKKKQYARGRYAKCIKGTHPCASITVCAPQTSLL